jgi:hypothetical protein
MRGILTVSVASYIFQFLSNLEMMGLCLKWATAAYFNIISNVLLIPSTNILQQLYW